MAAIPGGIDPAWIALIGTVFGGVGLKMAERALGRSKERSDDATQIRDELRIEIVSQRDEIKALEAEVEKWRAEYYNLRDQHVKMQTELTLALERLKAATPLDPPIKP
jgi:predicted RNase H-like nuclease (RuvC/YqgF family)